MNSERVRASREFKSIIDFIRSKYILEGKRPPGTASITKVIAGKINREELLKDVIIKF